MAHTLPLNKDEKKCSRCPSVLPATEQFFGKDSNSADGLRSECRPCRKKMLKESRDKKSSKKSRGQSQSQSQPQSISQSREKSQSRGVSAMRTFGRYFALFLVSVVWVSCILQSAFNGSFAFYGVMSEIMSTSFPVTLGAAGAFSLTLTVLTALLGYGAAIGRTNWALTILFVIIEGFQLKINYHGIEKRTLFTEESQSVEQKSSLLSEIEVEITRLEAENKKVDLNDRHKEWVSTMYLDNKTRVAALRQQKLDLMGLSELLNKNEISQEKQGLDSFLIWALLVAPECGVIAFPFLFTFFREEAE